MLSLMELSGSPFKIGQSLGRFGAEAAHGHLVRSTAWDSVMAWRDTDAARAMQDLVTRHFPEIDQELAGLAVGLELPQSDVFLWNCRGDLWSMAPDGCTTVQLPLSTGPRITHNEDGDPGFAGYCGIAEFIPDGQARFTSFVYPASIPGHTFAVNDAGLVMTVNNLRSRLCTVGVPRMVLTRALLNQSGLRHAIDLLQAMPRAGGFHLSMAQRGHAELLSVEFSAKVVSVQTITQPSVHANHAIHADMQDFSQVITQSSLCRQQRGEALLQSQEADPLVILGDQANRNWPIFRDAPDDSDGENTMATADIHVAMNKVTWEVYERPGQAVRFTLADGRLAPSL